MPTTSSTSSRDAANCCEGSAIPTRTSRIRATCSSCRSSRCVTAAPPKAQSFYLDRIQHFRDSGMDWLILGLGAALFLAQIFLSWRALRWRDTGFDERTDRWLTNLAQAAEWFPMLGLIGTVAGILDAFATHGSAGAIQPRVIAPAITATGAGLFMALINILPTWIVTLGRDFILLLSGTPRPQPSEPEA